MHAVCADVGLLKNNKIMLLSQNKYYKDIIVTDLLHPTVTILKFKMGFLRDDLH